MDGILLVRSTYYKTKKNSDQKSASFLPHLPWEIGLMSANCHSDQISLQTKNILFLGINST